MSEKNKKMWQLVMLLAVNLLIMASLSLVLRADALCLGCSGENVAAVQRILKQKGLYGGEISGEYDFETRKSVKAFQSQNDIAQSGEADYETVCVMGLDSRSGECFSMQTELLARYLKVNGGAGYAAMLDTAEKILENAGSLPLSRYILESDSGFCKNIVKIEPSSEAYAAALQAIRQSK